MQKFIALTVAVLSCGPMVFAQDQPRAEIFLGYTFLRANAATNIPAFSTNGGGGQFAFNFNKWLGFVADMGATHNGNINNRNIDSTYTDFLFGPRISWRHSRLTPYGQILLGGLHAGASQGVSAILATPPTVSNPIFLPGTGTVTNNSPVTLRAVSSQTAFAFALGGGLDLKINNHMSFRPVELDYFFTRLQNPLSLQDNNQHNLRYMAGINFTFGAR